MKDEPVHEDAEIVREMKRENTQAMEWLIARYGDTLKSVISYHMRYCQRDDREDCLNEVLFAIWQNIHSFRQDKGTLQNWIAGVAKFSSMAYARKLFNRRKNEMPDGMEKMDEGAKEDVYRFFEEELSEETEMLLQCLKPVERELILAYYMKECPIDELAAKYKIKEKSVYKRLERAKKKIQRYVKGDLL